MGTNHTKHRFTATRKSRERKAIGPMRSQPHAARCGCVLPRALISAGIGRFWAILACIGTHLQDLETKMSDFGVVVQRGQSFDDSGCTNKLKWDWLTSVTEVEVGQTKTADRGGTRFRKMRAKGKTKSWMWALEGRSRSAWSAMQLFPTPFEVLLCLLQTVNKDQQESSKDDWALRGPLDPKSTIEISSIFLLGQVLYFPHYCWHWFKLL